MRRALALFSVLFGAVSGGAEPVAEHVVQPGETLSQIAARFAGNPGLWPLLYRANRDQIKDPARLYPGQALRIPDLRVEGAVSEPEPGRGSEAQIRH